MEINFTKYPNGLVPAIVQDERTRVVLMLGFMNKAAYEQTVRSGIVTFFSRTKQRLWTKGETSGNFLSVNKILTDCDTDAILIKATPSGPVCHTGAETCFGEANKSRDFLSELEAIIADRRRRPVDGSYTSTLFADGINRIAQKVGEEAVELIIEAKDSNNEAFIDEAADLLYHFVVLLTQKNVRLSEVYEKLRSRNEKGRAAALTGLQTELTG